ncbi:hypothetical protein V8G54_037733 [Vigna mungo]|uniref:Uncharacterized protein n=1 Tax=Vigna mungo TaxID=3915 RepID=A0AAQ3MKV9_VIGMU
MAKYSKAMLVFGLGVLVVSMWCMKGTEGSLEDDAASIIHTVKRDDPSPHQGCGGSSHTEGGVEQCSDEDDRLGLYADVDDTFKAAAKKLFHSHDDNDDSPDLAHNNVNVLGH